MFKFAINFLLIALHERIGAVIALLFAALVNLLSNVSYEILAESAPSYMYYASLFLIVFAWFSVTCKLELFYSQIIAGVATVFMSLSVVDCYFSNGYETTISIYFSAIVTAINILTILAAWNDRNWISPINIDCWGKGSNKNSEADNKC